MFCVSQPRQRLSASHARIRLAVSMARLFAACTYLTVGHAVLHVVGAAVALQVGVLRRGRVEGGVGHVCCVVACSRC